MSVEERLPSRSEVIPRDQRGSDRAFLVEELRRLASPSSSGRTVPLCSAPNEIRGNVKLEPEQKSVLEGDTGTIGIS